MEKKDKYIPYEEMPIELADNRRKEGEMVINNEIITFKVGDSAKYNDGNIYEIVDIYRLFDIETLKPVDKIIIKWINGESRSIDEKNIVEIIKN